MLMCIRRMACRVACRVARVGWRTACGSAWASWAILLRRAGSGPSAGGQTACAATTFAGHTASPSWASPSFSAATCMQQKVRIHVRVRGRLEWVWCFGCEVGRRMHPHARGCPPLGRASRPHGADSAASAWARRPVRQDGSSRRLPKSEPLFPAACFEQASQRASKKKVLSLPCLSAMSVAKMPSCGFGLKPCVTSQLCNSVFQDFGAFAVPYRLFRRRAH